MKNFNSFLNEKLGINKEVEKFSSILYDIIIKEYKKNKPKNKIKIISKYKFFYPVEKIPPEIVNNRVVNSFKIIINFKPWRNNQMRQGSYDDGSIKVEFNISPDDDFTIKREVIEHEIKHLYQYSRRINKDNVPIQIKNKDVYDDLTNIKSYYKDNDFQVFNDLIYLSLGDEIDARTQECYIELKKLGTTKENFKENIKGNKQYGYAIRLFDHDVVDEIKGDDPIKFVSAWNFLYNNKEALNKHSDFSGFMKFIYKISPSKLHDLYLKHFGPIKKSEFIKNNPNVELYIPRLFYDEISEKEANDFLNKWSKVFTDQGRKFSRKIHRLYDLFD